MLTKEHYSASYSTGNDANVRVPWWWWWKCSDGRCGKDSSINELQLPTHHSAGKLGAVHVDIKRLQEQIRDTQSQWPMVGPPVHGRQDIEKELMRWRNDLMLRYQHGAAASCHQQDCNQHHLSTPVG